MARTLLGRYYFRTKLKPEYCQYHMYGYLVDKNRHLSEEELSRLQKISTQTWLLYKDPDCENDEQACEVMLKDLVVYPVVNKINHKYICFQNMKEKLPQGITYCELVIANRLNRWVKESADE